MVGGTVVGGWLGRERLRPWRPSREPSPGMLLWVIKIPDETRAQTDEDARVSCRATDDAQGTACGKQTLGERT